MPNDNKLYLCFEYCEFDLKKYMKSQSYKVRREPGSRPFCMHERAARARRHPPTPAASDSG